MLPPSPGGTVLVRLMITLLVPAGLSGQLHLTALVGVADHSGHARDLSDVEQPSFGPGTTRESALAIGIDRGPWRIALRFRRETPDLILVGETSGIITRDALAASHGGLEIGRRIAGGPAAPALHVIGGAGVTRWEFPGFEDAPRNRYGAWLALEGGLPLRSHLEGVLRLEALNTGSLFETEDLPEGYSARSARRLGLSLGLRWRK